jgi:branched-chain amino acid transport system ATP-binding protein
MAVGQESDLATRRRGAGTVPDINLTARAGAAQPLLAISDLAMRFGGVVALDGVSFAVNAGEICGIIGPNGSGKTTLFNCISRIYHPVRGDIVLDGQSLLASPRRAMAALGIARTFQNLALFRRMPVRENILVGRHSQMRTGFFEHAFRLPAVRREESEVAEEADRLIDFLDLGAVQHELVDTLPFGTQKRVELARALAIRPKLLLLDEPAGGLNHTEVDALRALIGEIRDRFRLTVLLVEHHMNLVMRVSDRVVALDFGRKIAEGRPEEVQQNDDVIRAYLGPGAHAGTA